MIDSYASVAFDVLLVAVVVFVVDDVAVAEALNVKVTDALTSISDNVKENAIAC